MHILEPAQLFIPSGITVYIAGGAVVVGAIKCENVHDVTIRGRGILYMSDFEQRTFYRTSDDCIDVYGTRTQFKHIGDSRNVIVRNSVLWADVAHPVMIDVHGYHQREGDILENLLFDNIDILEHHEPQDGYWGCMAINVGDKNTVRNVTFRNIRVEQFEMGRLIDIRVFHNKKYNPDPGKRVENIRFENVAFTGTCENPSVIEGYDETRIVDGVTFHNLRINGRHILNKESGK